VWRQLNVSFHISCQLKKQRNYSQFHQHFTNSFFGQYSFSKKLQNQIVSREKLHRTLSFKKAAREMLVKLKPTNTFWLPFLRGRAMSGVWQERKRRRRFLWLPTTLFLGSCVRPLTFNISRFRFYSRWT